MLLERFQIIPFIIGLAVSTVVFFYLKPDTKDRVVKWPHPSNAGSVTYRDRNGLCYKFEAQIADCEKVKESLQAYAFE